MKDPVSLSDHGITLWRGLLENHDFLWFATSDVNATATTWPILHNYALTYAIWQLSHAAYRGYRPNYDGDLAGMTAYALPAYSPRAGRTRLTYNALDEVTQRTDTIVRANAKAVPARFNTPKLGHRVCLTPAATGSTSLQAKERTASGFELYLFSWGDFHPPSVFRLGKKGCPIRVFWSPIDGGTARIPEKEFTPDHPLNPRDLVRPEPESVVSYYPAIIPPHVLYLESRLRGEWAVHAGDGRMVHVPKRVVARWQSDR